MSISNNPNNFGLTDTERRNMEHANYLALQRMRQSIDAPGRNTSSEPMDDGEAFMTGCGLALVGVPLGILLIIGAIFYVIGGLTGQGW